MRDHQHRGPGLRHELEKEVEHRVPRGLVEIARGLVGEDQVGLPRQGAGDGHALLLAARELLGIALGQCGEAETVDQVPVARGVVPPAQTGLKRDIGGHGQRRDEVELLKHQPRMPAPDPRARRVGQGRQVVAHQPHMPRIRRVQPPGKVEKGAFPRPAFAGEGQRLAPPEGQGHVVEHGHGRIGAGITPCSRGRGGGRDRSWRAM
jgi:hypothetical protein